MRRFAATFVVGGGGALIAEAITRSVPEWPGVLFVYLWGAFIGMIVCRFIEE